ncbi:hypothetical protein RI129_003888 [Pyrocoelia pectoralis]|uniref:Dymeclin n=1 Tax=Pyrocoelia pectoralis TaxID=417401 RepID=A0AAN7ZV41_9COLE
MGTALSRTVDLSTNEYILRFIGNETITPNDPFWNRFLAFNISLPKTSEDQLALDTKVEPFCQQLLSNNLKTGNVGCLIQVFLSRASELLAATNTDDNIFSWQTFNALFIIRCVVKYFTDVITEEQFVEHIECYPSNISRLETFVGSLIGIVVDVPLKDFTYAVHLESVTCLLVLLSIHLHSQKKADQCNIYRLIMRGRHAIHAPLLVKSLLFNYIEQQKAPPVYGTNSGNQSIVYGLATGFWSMITFNRKSNESVDNTQNNFADVPLATASLSLILVLTNHCTAQVNPYRQSLFTCVNSEDNSPIAPTKASTLCKINYSNLYVTLCKKANQDSTTLLLYLLLHRNISFRNYVLNKTGCEELIIPILKTLYHAPNCDSHHIYMSLIILLILSEDDTFNKSIHSTKLKGVTWYVERSLPEISLGGLLVLVVIRTVQYNMLKMRDKYLHTNCLAALANMSGQFRDLHPYVSQRLVSLFETLARRYRKISQQLDTEKPNEVTVNVTTESEEDILVLEEVLRMLLEIFNSCLVHQLVNNPNLVYTLLYKKHIFEPFKNNPTFQDIVQNIEIVIEYFSDQLSIKSQEHEVDFHEVLVVIQEGAKRWPKEKLTKFPDLKFKYVEEEQPEEFFIPYVWSLVNNHSLLQWGTDGQLLNAVC